MKLVIASVRDVKSEAYGRPFFVNSVGVAIRSFDDEVNRAAEDNIMYHHPADFALFQIGTFDDSDGSIEPMIPKLLLQGMQTTQRKAVENAQK